jgi:CheY-like chemotaxis protein
VLNDAGCEAADGRQGLQRFFKQPMELVMTRGDLEMPEMTGLEVILELTRTLSNVKVIAMSDTRQSRGRKNRRHTWPVNYLKNITRSETLA